MTLFWVCSRKKERSPAIPSSTFFMRFHLQLRLGSWLGGRREKRDWIRWVGRWKESRWIKFVAVSFLLSCCFVSSRIFPLLFDSVWIRLVFWPEEVWIGSSRGFRAGIWGILLRFFSFVGCWVWEDECACGMQCALRLILQQRLVLFITGIENIRDVVPFPRQSGGPVL